MKGSHKFHPEIHERAARIVQEHRGESTSLWASIESIAPKIGCVVQMLNDRAKRVEVDTGVLVGSPPMIVNGPSRSAKPCRLPRSVVTAVKRAGIVPRCSALSTCTTQSHLAAASQAGLTGQCAGLRRRQGLAQDEARRHCCGAVRPSRCCNT